MNPIIKVENLSKQYRLGARQSPYTTLGERVAGAIRAPLRQLRRDGAAGEQVWALKDVNFEVQAGEAVGIIGSNGAGKSTLLKVLSRIADPTTGRIELYGRVGSLLEVGTGFHPELTGRENVYLNGAILGMQQTEINHKFDEIVAFAEIEKFLDTPVKHYSSGMYMRLAFAVAAHLEPEILIIDEVLAVGDIAFQKKCIGKMGEVAREGRTVIFVSHNIAAITRLCQRVLWFEQGQMRLEGPTPAVVSTYLSDSTHAAGERLWDDEAQAGNKSIRLHALRVRNAEDEITPTVDVQRPFSIELEYQILDRLPPLRVGFTLSTSDGIDLFASNEMVNPTWVEQFRPPGRYVSRCTIPGNLLNTGSFNLRVSADIPFKEILFNYEYGLTFEIAETGGVAGRFPEKWPGVICPQLPWVVSRQIETGDDQLRGNDAPVVNNPVGEMST